ncbi:MAG TPA: penicillin-binding protein [Rhizobiales bacterium]|nr:penicillin-binding protein [Hyphomicrobiales bacterium]HAN63844.1 penicillin-binding protein [Hyphomicrobiales bacterium]HBH41894.1 penicillin-binding protein [Hyphomicrobiales bacterium]
MRDIFNGRGRSKLIDWLKVDSWIDSGLYNAWTRFRDWWSGYSSFFGKFEVKGFVRALNEIACEGLTLGVGALLVLAAFALPAFEIAQGKMNLSDEYSVTFLDRYGNDIGKRGLLRDDSVPLDEIPDVMIKATLATEDRRFFEHFGVDIMGTFRALAANARHDTVVQGGSSLTQQLAKNMFLSPERSLSRKIREAIIAVYLENHYTKAEILKLYFDRAYLGGGSYGVEAAAQYYFGKSIRDVNLAEAAMLAGMFKAPTRYAPHVNLAASRARANEVLSNMVEAGFMSEGQVYGARMNPAKVVERGESNTPDYFLDWAFEEVQRLMRGKEDHIVVARTTVDTGLQKMAEQALEDTIAQSGRARHFEQGAMIVMENDGAVRALVGGKDYGESQFNRATHAYRQPGSSFKPYVYLTAFETGKYTPTTMVNGGGAACGHWAPKNFSAGEGNRMMLKDALAHSINTIAVKVSLDVGREKVLATMNKLGITRLKKTCSLALGDQGLTPLEHVTNYAVFASGGLEVHSYAIEEVRALSSGDLIYNHDRDEPPRKQLFSRKSVEMLNTMLQGVVTGGTGRAAQLDFTYAIGKTGTSSAFRDAWFMGITGQYVAGVWLGNDDYTPMSRVTGGSFPAQTWHAFMVAAHDTDNIAQIPGIDVHPAQAAEQARLAAAAAQNATANAEAAPAAAPESVKDMSAATKQVLEKIGSMLKDARTLTPSEAARPDRAEAPAAPAQSGSPNPSLASAANADGAPRPTSDTPSASAEPQTALSADGAPAPR